MTYHLYSRCVAERTRISGYVMFSTVLAGVIYPMAAQWVWSDQGFLYTGTKALPWLKFHDFAGSVVVHVVGGVAGLIFSIAVGPRLGRFNTNKDSGSFNSNNGMEPNPRRSLFRLWRSEKKESGRNSPKLHKTDQYEDGTMFEGHDPSLVAAGTFILWFGWYGFNAGSTRQLSDGGAELAARAFGATSMGAAGGVLMAVVLHSLCVVHFTPQVLCNALLAGLVSITASCTIIEMWAALVIGATGVLVAILANKAITWMRVDDPLQAFAVHGAAGIWGGLAAGLFGAEWSTHPAGWEQFASQVIGLVVIITWTAGMSSIALCLIQAFLQLLRIGGLRVPASEELEGLDTLFDNNSVGGRQQKTKGVVAPEGVITIVSTDVQGSTNLWANDPQAMSACTALHDHIMRSELARCGGYEITTEGDAFLIAFNSAVSAVNFCTKVQTALLYAEWPKSIMSFPDCYEVYHLDSSEEDGLSHVDEDPAPSPSKGGLLTRWGGNDPTSTNRGVLIHRGLRIRMGIDVGHCKRLLHPTTRTFRYKGTPIMYAKALVNALPSGGVVAMTHRVQSEMAGQMSLSKGSSLCHLGIHVMSEKISAKCSIFALVPAELESRLLRMKPLEAKFEIAPGYLNAPGVTPKVALPVGLDTSSSSRSWENWERGRTEDKASNKATTRNTLAVYCHNNPEARPIVVAFASLVLVEDMTTRTATTDMPRRMSEVLFGFPGIEGDVDDPGSPKEGSVRRGISYLSAILGDSVARRSGTGTSPRTSAPKVRVSLSVPDFRTTPVIVPEEIEQTSLYDTTGSNHSQASKMMSPVSRPVMQALRDEAQRLAGPMVRMSLAMTNGYECQEDEGCFMVAFDSALDAARWGAMLCRIIDSMFADRFSIAVGMHRAMPTSISPHVSSGRADYFGTVVNAAARVHSLAATSTKTKGRSTTIVSRTTFDQVQEAETLAPFMSPGRSARSPSHMRRRSGDGEPTLSSPVARTAGAVAAAVSAVEAITAAATEATEANAAAANPKP
jgi:ammonia channel protein AmtB